MKGSEKMLDTGTIRMKPSIEPELSIRRVTDISDELRDILGDVEQRSFVLLERRDGECGRDLADWLAAEAELVYETPVTVADLADRSEIRIGLEGRSSQEVSLFLTDQRLVVRGKKRGWSHKWLLVRVDLPAGVDPATARAAMESGELLVILIKKEKKDDYDSSK